jgi:Phosphopantothenoylcysteine synthetase/decarboxylase
MNEVWKGKHILLGVTGGVAIYKAATLASRMTQAGALVDVVMTPSAIEFVRPLLFASLTRRQVHVDPWVADRKPEHIALAERPDLVVVAPATANIMAKMATGVADNLLTSTLLACTRPVLLAPAMNTGMWNAPATRRNVETLQADGCRFVGPDAGNLACGDAGTGRMAEPEAILAATAELLKESEPRNRC